MFVNHTGDASGAEVAMLRLARALEGRIECAIACPPDGPLAERVADEGFTLLPIPGTAVSFRLHPRWTLVGLADIARSNLVLRRHVRAWRPDVLHANGTRAGLLAAGLRRGRRPAVLVQIHDIMPPSTVAATVRRFVARSADRVVTVSDAATAAFNRGLPQPAASTLYIGIDQAAFRPGSHDTDAVRRALGVEPGAPLLGEVAQISPWKGQLAAIEALAVLRRTHPDAVLLLIGDISFAGPSVRYDNHAYARRLRERVAELGLGDAVRFLGRRDDVPAIMAALDLLLLPSWDEPVGTVVAEAMTIGTVPLLTRDGGVRELVEDGVTGRVLPPREPEAWARAAAELLDDRPRLAEMGRRAAASVAEFTIEAYADRAMRVYEELVAALDDGRR